MSEQQAQPAPADEALPVEPGHVMSHAAFERINKEKALLHYPALAREAANQK